MSKIKIIPDVEIREDDTRIRLVAMRKIPLIITSDLEWHHPKRRGEEFDFPEKEGMILIKRGLAEEVK